MNLCVIRAMRVLCQIVLVARQFPPMAVPRTADRPLAPDEQALEIVDQKGCGLETVIFGWLIAVASVHIPFSQRTYSKLSHTASWRAMFTRRIAGGANQRGARTPAGSLLPALLCRAPQTRYRCADRQWRSAAARSTADRTLRAHSSRINA
jgi:hypothetical protein